MTLRQFIDKHFEGSQARFAEKAKLNQGQLSKYLALERGEDEGQSPGTTNLAKIERVAGPGFGSAYWAALLRRMKDTAHASTG